MTIERFHPYPFEQLTRLLRGVTPCSSYASDPINLSIGEPRHRVSSHILKAMVHDLERDIRRYPTTRGDSNLREAIANWLIRRFQLPSDAIHPDQNLLPVNGTREALFSIAQTVISDSDRYRAVVIMPNPFYQIYEGATFMAGAEPFYLNTTATTNFLPDYNTIPVSVLKKTRLLYLCTPANPTGAIHDLPTLCHLIEMAHQHDFVIASDECYSEIWYDNAPPGLLQAAHSMGVDDFRHCLVFHSLSKRSNMPGARSGFVAGDATLLRRYFKLRTYTGCATPPFIQKAAAAAWRDEKHVTDNRTLYREKRTIALKILSPVLTVEPPKAGFYLWIQPPNGGETFARHLFEQYALTVLPGAYLGRKADGSNPGTPFVRVALVESLDNTREAMRRLANCIQNQRTVHVGSSPTPPTMKVEKRDFHGKLKERIALC